MPRKPASRDQSTIEFDEIAIDPDGRNVYLKELKLKSINGTDYSGDLPDWVDHEEKDDVLRADGTREKVIAIQIDITGLEESTSYVFELVGSDGTNEATREVTLTVTFPENSKLDIIYQANSVGDDPGFLSFDLNGLARSIFWNGANEKGYDVRVRKSRETLPAKTFSYDDDDRLGRVFWHDPNFDHTKDQKYEIWFENPDVQGPPDPDSDSGVRTLAQKLEENLNDLKVVFFDQEQVDGKLNNLIASESGVTLEYAHDYMPGDLQRCTFRGTQNTGEIKQPEDLSGTLRDDFENGVGDWTNAASSFSQLTDFSYEGSASGGINDGSQPNVLGELEAESEFQPFDARFYYRETSSQTGSGLRFIDGNGNHVVSWASDNPQWLVYDDNGFYEIDDADGYERWIEIYFNFYWDKGEYDIRVEDLQSGRVEKRTGRTLENATGVKKIRLQNQNSEDWSDTSPVYSWFDNIRVPTVDNPGDFRVKTYGEDLYDRLNGESIIKRVRGDFSVTAKLSRVPSFHQYQKAGVIALSPLSSFGSHAIQYISGQEKVHSRRKGTVGSSNSKHINAVQSSFPNDKNGPLWLRLKRESGKLKYYYSRDGQSYTKTAEINNFLPESLPVGFAAASHDTDDYYEVDVDNLEIQGEFGGFQFGDDQVVRLKGYSIDPSSGENLPHTHLATFGRQKTKGMGEEMILSYDRSEYFRFNTVDSDDDHLGLSTAPKSAGVQDNTLSDYNIQTVEPVFSQWTYDKDSSDPTKLDVVKPNSQESRVRDSSGSGEPLESTSERFGLIGANSEVEQYGDGAFSSAGVNYDIEFFMWGTGQRTESKRDAARDFFKGPYYGDIWDFPIVFVFVKGAASEKGLNKQLGEPSQKDSGEVLSLTSDVSLNELLGKPSQKTPTLLETPGFDLHVDKLFGELSHRVFNEVQLTTSIGGMFTPPSLEASYDDTNHQVDLTASNFNVSNVQQIDFEKAESGAGFSNLTSITANSDPVSYSDSGISDWTIYFYKAATSDGGGNTSIFSARRRVAVESSTDITINSIDFSDSQSGNELTVDASSPNGSLSYSLNGGSYQSSSTFSGVAEDTDHTISVDDTVGTTSITVTVPPIEPIYTSGAYSLKQTEDLSAQIDSLNDSVIMEGDKFYITDWGNGKIFYYKMSTKNDLTTLSFEGEYDVPASYPDGIEMTPDGKTVYYFDDGSGSNHIDELSLSTAYDITTASYVQNFNLTDSPDHLHMCYGVNGDKLYGVGGQNNRVVEWNLSTSYDISTASKADERVFNEISSSGGLTVTNSGMLLGPSELYTQEGSGVSGFVHEGPLQNAYAKAPASENDGEILYGIDSKTLEKRVADSAVSQNIFNLEDFRANFRTAGVNPSATWADPGVDYEDLSPSEKATVYCNVDISSGDSGIIMEAGASGDGLALFTDGSSLYFACGRGSGTGSSSRRAWIKVGMPTGTGINIEWSGNVETDTAALYIDGNLQGTDSFNESQMSGSNPGGIAGTHSSLRDVPSGVNTSGFDGTVNECNIFENFLTKEVT